MDDFNREDLRSGALPQVSAKTGSEDFENAIRRFGIGNACEYFGYEFDGQFSQDTLAWLKHRYEESNK